MTGIWHAMGKQPITGGLCYVKLNGLKDSHLLCHFLEDIQGDSYVCHSLHQCQMLRYKTCN